MCIRDRDLRSPTGRQDPVVVIILILVEEPKGALFADGPTTINETAGRSRNLKENLQLQQPLERSQPRSRSQKQIDQLLVEVEKKRRQKDSRRPQRPVPVTTVVKRATTVVIVPKRKSD